MAVQSSRYTVGAMRDITSNANAGFDQAPKGQQGFNNRAPTNQYEFRSDSDNTHSSEGVSQEGGLASRGVSPGADLHKRHPFQCSDMVQDIVEMFYLREKSHPRDPNYMAQQTEVNEKMRTILIDWLVDVHLKFKLHPETFFLAVDLVDRYLSQARVSRSQLQLVGITCMLLAAKYEEIWPPEMSECIHVAANTYSREDILKMERAIAGTLSFKLTTPTPFPLLIRLLEVTEADDTTRHAAFFFLEHAVLNYKYLSFLPSQLAHASLYLAHVMLRRSDPWSYTCQYYSRASVEDVKPAAKAILDFAALITNSKYQAIRRKYSSTKFSEVSRMVFPTELPL